MPAVEDIERRSKAQQRRAQIKNALIVPINEKPIDERLAELNIDEEETAKAEQLFVKMLHDINIEIAAVDGIIEKSKSADKNLTSDIDTIIEEFRLRKEGKKNTRNTKDPNNFLRDFVRRDDVRNARKKAQEQKIFLYQQKNDLIKRASGMGIKISDNRLLQNTKAVMLEDVPAKELATA